MHVHAKDAEVIDRNVKRNGILGRGSAPPHPGMGIVDWAAVCSALVEVGYKATLTSRIAMTLCTTVPARNRGLVISLQHLKQFTKPEWWVSK